MNKRTQSKITFNFLSSMTIPGSMTMMSSMTMISSMTMHMMH